MRIDITRNDMVIEVCVECFFEHQYPGEHETSRPREQLWTDQKPADFVPGVPFGHGECPHSDTEDEDLREEHASMCEIEDFSFKVCDACGTTLAGTRYLMTGVD